MPVAPDLAQLQELDEETRLAWSSYVDAVRELSGAEYERVEPESWEALQAELRRLDNQRESIVTSQPGVGPGH